MGGREGGPPTDAAARSIRAAWHLGARKSPVTVSSSTDSDRAPGIRPAAANPQQKARQMRGKVEKSYVIQLVGTGDANQVLGKCHTALATFCNICGPCSAQL